MTHKDPNEFWANVRIEEDPRRCWEWIADIPYPTWMVNGIRVPAARYAWEMEHGPVTPGKKLIRKCGNVRCVRPRHMRIAWAPPVRRRPTKFGPVTEQVKDLRRRHQDRIVAEGDSPMAEKIRHSRLLARVEEALPKLDYVLEFLKEVEENDAEHHVVQRVPPAKRRGRRRMVDPANAVGSGEKNGGDLLQGGGNTGGSPPEGGAAAL